MLVRLHTTNLGMVYANAGQISSIRPGAKPGQTIVTLSDGLQLFLKHDVHEVAQVVESHLSEYVHPEKRLMSWHLDESEQAAAT
ncbi:MAG: hypothetical protein SFZ23_02080 [Planctomycetota bacterium]|nr:hypothetical protein [Planctomycetota bacterium]